MLDKNLKVAMLVSNPATADNRVIKMAEALAEKKVDITILATSRQFQDNAYEEKNGVKYNRFPYSPAEELRNTLLPQVLKKRAFARKAALKTFPYLKYELILNLFEEYLLKIKPHVIHAHDLICLPVAVKCAKKIGAKVIYDAHELEAHRNPPLPLLEKHTVMRLEKKFGKQCDAIITVGQEIKSELLKEINNKNIHVIYNSPVLGKQHTSDVRKDMNLMPYQPLLVYVGKATVNRGIELVIDALSMLPGVYFACVGPCGDKEFKEITNYAKQKGVESRFKILNPVHHEFVVDYISSADIGVIPAIPLAKSYYFGMPNKLFEMSFARLPILSSNLIEVERFLNELNHGTVYNSSTEHVIPTTLSKMLTEKNKYNITDQKFDILQLEYSWNTMKGRLYSIYEDILS